MDKPNKYILIVGSLIILICYFLWFSPLFMAIGGIMILADVACYIHYYFKKDNKTVENTGCLCALFFVILITVSFFMGGEYKISSFGGKRHLYEDCQFLESVRIHDVHKMSALLWGCVDDCKFCNNRRHQEALKEKQQRMEKLMKENLDFIDQQISELQEVRNEIFCGKVIDAEDYQFRYEVEEEIREAAIEEYRDGEYEPRGRR